MTGPFPPAHHDDDVAANSIGDGEQNLSKIFPGQDQRGNARRFPMISRRQGQQTGQKRRISIRVPVVGTPSLRHMLRGIGKHIVINVGVSHAAEEEAVVQQDGKEEREEQADG